MHGLPPGSRPTRDDRTYSSRRGSACQQRRTPTTVTRPAARLRISANSGHPSGAAVGIAPSVTGVTTGTGPRIAGWDVVAVGVAVRCTPAATVDRCGTGVQRTATP